MYFVSQPVPFCETGSLIRAMRSKLYAEIKLCRCLLREYSGSPDKPSRVTLSELPVNEMVEALCTKNNIQLEKAVYATVDIAVEKEMTQLGFIQFLDAVISDQRLISHSTANLKIDLSEALSNAATPEGLKADILQVLCQFSMGESKSDKKMMVSQIKQYLTENYTKSISNEMLSVLFGFVPSYISKIFRQHTGVSPSEYITELRIERAKTLLETRRDLLIRDVSLLVGYNDPYYFSKAFKKITGHWPTQYQESFFE
jgi:YesN/AraC family two-component response regulator